MKSKISFISLLLLVFIACKKQDIGPLSDLRDVNSISITNATDFRPDPTITVSKSGAGNISIVLTLSSKTGRTIKEITKVAASTSYSLIQGLAGATGFVYNTASLAGSGTTITFNTSLTEYVNKGGKLPTATNLELANRFYFLVTLDDGTIVITTPVRVLYLD